MWMWCKYAFIMILCLLSSCSPQLAHHEYSTLKITGIIEHGKQEARKLGFPTANVRLEKDIHILPGIYSCKAEIFANTYTAMCYVDPCNPEILEVHLFNFKGDLYNQILGVYLTNFIRMPIAFEDMNTLKLQIKKDADICLNL